MAPSELRHAALAAARRLAAAGHTAYWAGGCVRDELLGRAPKDYDIATSAAPDDVVALFPGSQCVGKAFGVVRAPLGGHWFEVATFRADAAYSDGRRPEAVRFADPATDAARRDFTINALFMEPATGAVIDYVGGQADIRAEVVRCVGEPDDRFREDYLRMLRAVRFAATLAFRLDEATAAAIREAAGRAAQIAAERVRIELTRMLTESPRPGDAVRLLDATGLLAVLLPEIKALQGQEQPPAFHPEGDVFQHTTDMLNLLASPSPRLAWAALLHDVGKPATAQAGPDRIRFPMHASVGAAMAADILQRLRFSADDTEYIAACVRGHMRFADVRAMRPATLRRMAGAPTFDDELELHRVDCLASHGELGNHRFLEEYRRALAAEPVLPEPWVNGRDIMRLGVPEGPEVGRWRQAAYDAQLEGLAHSREGLLAWLAGQLRKPS